MSEAVFGFIGVLVGACVPWLQASFSERRSRTRNARYLAIRVVCILDKYLEDCATAVSDHGHCNENGVTEAAVSNPGAPSFPEDVDWQSIDHALMYKALSLSRDAETAGRAIAGAEEFGDGPPDYNDFFEERTRRYGQLGLAAFEITQALRSKYQVPPTESGDWNPVEQIHLELKKLTERQGAQALRAQKTMEALIGTAGG